MNAKPIPPARSSLSRSGKRVEQVVFRTSEASCSHIACRRRQVIRNSKRGIRGGVSKPDVHDRNYSSGSVAIPHPFRGKWKLKPFLKMLQRPQSPPSEGLYLSLVCAEDTVRITPAEVKAQTANTFLGDYRVRRQMDACKEWPLAKILADFYEPVVFKRSSSTAGVSSWTI